MADVLRFAHPVECVNSTLNNIGIAPIEQSIMQANNRKLAPIGLQAVANEHVGEDPFCELELTGANPSQKPLT